MDDIIECMKTNLVVLEAERREIRKDIKECLEMTRKFGNLWDGAIRNLTKMEKEREEDMKEIQIHLNLLNIQIQNCQKLVHKLRGRRFQLKRTNVSIPNIGVRSEVFEIHSPILSRSRKIIGDL